MIDGDWLRPVVSGLAGGTLVAVLAAFVGRPAADRAGWRRIAPSALHFEDGTVLRIDPHARGARELVEAAEARLPGA